MNDNEIDLIITTLQSYGWNIAEEELDA